MFFCTTINLMMGFGGFKTINPGDGTGSYTQHGVGIHGVSVPRRNGPFPYNSVITNHANKIYEDTPAYNEDQLKATFFHRCRSVSRVCISPGSTGTGI